MIAAAVIHDDCASLHVPEPHTDRSFICVLVSKCPFIIVEKKMKSLVTMGLPSRLWMVFLLALTTTTSASATHQFGELGKNGNGLSRNDFPPEFIFGVGSCAYQFEGAAAEGGRKPSIWDTFIRTTGHTVDGGTGDVAVDQYHRYKEDVGLMSQMGVDAYRLSISWSRLIPDGRGAVNPEGLRYYNNLINELVAHGIQPHVELYHFDLPQALEDAYGGFISPQIVGDFLAYAEVCFREFGDRVKFWVTFNEPNIFAFAGYDDGGFPPGRCSYPFGNCSAGNSTIEPYIVGHNVLLAHAAAVKLYREKYQAQQRGSIGLPLLAFWALPFTNKSTDIAAAQRFMDFSLGWFLDPLVFGDYPVGMREIVGSRLPSFTEDQRQLVRGSFDFIGINYYFAFYYYDIPRKSDSQLRDYFQDISARVAVERDGIPIGNTSLLPGALVSPQSMEGVLEYIKQRYDNTPVIVYENGFSEPSNDSISLPEALNDQFRIDLHREVLQYVLAAVRNGSDTRGYFIWSLLDNFELLCSYTCRFGLHYVDFKGDLKRYPKRSAHWYKTFLQRRENKKLIDGSQILSNGYNYKSISLE